MNPQHFLCAIGKQTLNRWAGKYESEAIECSLSVGRIKGNFNGAPFQNGKSVYLLYLYRFCSQIHHSVIQPPPVVTAERRRPRSTIGTNKRQTKHEMGNSRGHKSKVNFRPCDSKLNFQSETGKTSARKICRAHYRRQKEDSKLFSFVKRRFLGIFWFVCVFVFFVVWWKKESFDWKWLGKSSTRFAECFVAD